MVKRVKVSLPAETSKATPIAEPNGVPQYYGLAAANLIVAAPGRLLDDDKLKRELTQGSYDLYRGLKPRNAQEAIVAMLAVGVANASLDYLALASRLNVEAAELRDLNLRHGLKGAAVATDLVKALKLRGEKPERVSVGSVNVEPGGQAIVGNVEAPKSSKGQKED
jgi:hypothetical protein